MHDNKKDNLLVQVHVLELEIRFRPVRFTLNTTLTQTWQRPITCIDVDGVDRSWNARVLRRWSDPHTFTSGCVFVSLFVFYLIFITLGTWVSRNVAGQVFKQLEIFFKEMLEYTRGGAWLSMFLSRAVRVGAVPCPCPKGLALDVAVSWVCVRVCVLLEGVVPLCFSNGTLPPWICWGLGSPNAWISSSTSTSSKSSSGSQR